MIFRILVLFFTIASIVLTSWAVVGSFKNQSHLTSNYLIDFQLTSLNISSLIKLQIDHNKRDILAIDDLTPSPTTKVDPRITPLAKRLDVDSITAQIGGDVNSALSGVGINANSLTALAGQQTGSVNQDVLSQIAGIASTASIPPSVASLASDLAGNLDNTINDVVGKLNYTDLGLADYYSASYWGYCRGFQNKNGTSNEELIDHLGSFGKNFNNQNIKWVYCSPPQVGFKFDPLELIKHEIKNQLQLQSDGLGDISPQLSNYIQAELMALVSGLTYENLGLPGSLNNDLELLHNITVAAFALLLAGACLAFISFIFQMVGLCTSPHNACLSCLNFLFMFITFLVIIIGAGLSTGAYVFARNEVNKNIKDYGVKSFLSIQYYAFAWSAMVAALLMVLFSAVGYCCGCIGGSGGKYKRVEEPAMAYDHKGSM